MQEFSSVTASSYDADALAPLLSAKSAEGWDVVSIVSAGTNIVAYLTRESSAAAADVVVVDTIEEVVVVEDGAVVADEIHAEEQVFVGGELVSDDDVTVEGVVDEPAGWAAEPEPSVDDLAAQISEPAAEPVAAATAAVAEPVAAAAPEPAPVQEAPPVESTVPAGWYADPSGRYELRYWDGTAWTEHVSRAGQQFTDPPVA